MGVTLFQIEERSFKRALQVALTTVYSGRGDDVREVFRFVKFRFYKFMKFRSYKGNVSVVSTDSFRMSRTWLGVTPTNGEGAFLVHYGKIRKLVRLLHGNSKEMVTFSVSDDEREVMVSSSRFEWNGGLWIDSYPDEEVVIPRKYDTTIEIPGDVLKSIMQFYKAISSNYSGVIWDIDVKHKKVKFVVALDDVRADRDNEAIVKKFGSFRYHFEKSSDGITIENGLAGASGSPVKVKLDIKFVLDFLKIAGKRNATISVIDSQNPVRFHDGYGEYDYIVMPKSM